MRLLHPCLLQGMVTHVTDVKPLAAVLTYLDQDSNTEVYQEVRTAAAHGGSYGKQWHASRQQMLLLHFERRTLDVKAGCCVRAHSTDVRGTPCWFEQVDIEQTKLTGLLCAGDWSQLHAPCC
jgi:hypothetical protein